MKPAAILACAFLLLTAFGLLAGMDQQHELSADSDYCQMVSLWKQDEAAGVKEVNRRGWPDFRKNYDITCNGYAGREQ